jgi:carbon monoxide dehydrogenase subunit G
MDEYISETVQILRSAETVYAMVSDLSHFTQAFASVQPSEVESFESTRDTCSFRVKGVETGIQIIDREPCKVVKYTGYKYSPFDFFLWIQFKEVLPGDTRMRIVLRAKMNLVTKMMFKGKIKHGLDDIATRLATALNNT